jgi:hypothetical protein
MGKKSSAVWTHFEKVDGEIRCTITDCKGPVLESKSSSTTSQWNHLEKYHNDIFKQMEAQKLPMKRKVNKDDAIAKTAKKSRQDESESQILRMLARRNVSFTLVDDPLFRRMTTKAFGIVNPNQSRHYARKVLPLVASEVLSKLREDVGDSPFAITTDGWSALNKPSPSLYRSFLNLIQLNVQFLV